MNRDGGITKAKAINLREHIQYQKGSIVSKTLIDKNIGTLTLFAFDEGQSLSEHKAPFDAVVYILEGEAQVIIEGKDINTGAGQIVIMPANVVHAIKAKKNFKMLLIMIRG